MTRIDPSSAVAHDICEAILSSPGWARVAITHPRADLRERAAAEMALAIVATLAPSADRDDPNQLRLAL
jgi:hypothetical protein